MKPMKRTKIIVIGASRLGANIARMFSERGEDVLMIDKSPEAFNKLSDGFSGYTICGDATEMSFLEANGIATAKKVIIATEDDNINILLAHASFYVYDVPRIYLRLSDCDKGKLIENTSIRAIYPFLLSINEFQFLDKE